MVRVKMDNKEEIWEKISDLWDPLNPEQREYLTQNLVVYTFKKDEPIYSEGDFPTRLMCLLDGKVKIFKNGTSGRNQIIRVIKPVEYFAYRAYFAHQRYLTAAAAFETSTIGMIPMSTIMHLVRENNDLAWFFIQQRRRKNRQPDPKTHQGEACRIPPVPQRKLWIGRRRMHIEHILVARRFSQPFEYDNGQCQPHPVQFRRRKNHRHRREENQNH